MPPAPVVGQTGDMKIATFNVNGINGRLPVLLRWLAEAKPDVVCLRVWSRRMLIGRCAVEKASDHAPTWIELGPCLGGGSRCLQPRDSVSVIRT